MDSRHKNQAAYKRMKLDVANSYPAGWYVAFDDGGIVADAATFDDLTAALAAVDKDRPDILVVQAGVNYPEEVFILI